MVAADCHAPHQKLKVNNTVQLLSMLTAAVVHVLCQVKLSLHTQREMKGFVKRPAHTSNTAQQEEVSE